MADKSIGDKMTIHTEKKGKKLLSHVNNQKKHAILKISLPPRDPWQFSLSSKVMAWHIELLHIKNEKTNMEIFRLTHIKRGSISVALIQSTMAFLAIIIKDMPD